MASIRKLARTGEDRWEARINRGKRGTMSRTFKSEQEALRWARQIEARIDAEGAVSLDAEKIMFTQACADFLAGWRPKGGAELPKSKRELVIAIGNDRVLKELSVAAVSHSVIADFIDRMLRTRISEPLNKSKTHPLYNGRTKRSYSASTVRKHFYAIKQVMEWHSITKRYTLADNLFIHQNVPSPWDGQRDRRLRESEQQKLEASAARCRHHKREWALLMQFALATAARSQEIMKAKWQDINLAGKAWNIPPENVKTKTFRQVALTPRAVVILGELFELRSPDSERVFHMWRDSATISKGWKRLAARAGIRDLNFHDLRHESVSRMFERTTLSDAEIMSITRHTNVATLRGYMHLRPSYLADKLSQVDM